MALLRKSNEWILAQGPEALRVRLETALWGNSFVGVGPRYLIDTILKRIKRGVIFDLKMPILAPK
jgi:hypothetical protein